MEDKGNVGDVVRHYLLRAQVTEEVNEVFRVVFASEKGETRTEPVTKLGPITILLPVSSGGTAKSSQPMEGN